MLNTVSVDARSRLGVAPATRVARYVQAALQRLIGILVQAGDWILHRPPKREILLISSDRDWAQLLQDALGSMAKVTMVGGTQVQAYLERQEYDLVLVDAAENMTMSAVGEEPRNQEFVNLISSARRQQGDRSIILVVGEAPTWRRVRDALRRGAADFVGKPVNAEELRDTLRPWLRKARSSRSRRPPTGG